MSDNLDILIHSDNGSDSDNVNFDEIENDIERFASEPSVRAVLEVGVDLQNYDEDIQKSLAVAEADSIEEYLKQIPRVERLHDEITSCDKVLETMEDLLVEFKKSLGQLSNDICNLQNRSQEITVKLNNRKELDSYLGEFTKNCCVTRDFMDKITNMEVGPEYQKIVQELVVKINFVNRKDISSSQAVQEAKVIIDTLRVRAGENIKKWLIGCINELKASNDSNSKTMKDKFSIQNSMIRSRNLVTFLKENVCEVEQLTRQYYINEISLIYLSDYKVRTKQLLKLMRHISMSNETIIPTSQRGFFKSRRIVGEATLFFSLGERQKLLNDMFAPPLVFTEDSYPVETLIRSLYQNLVDDVTSEHVFASEFFSDENITTEIFIPTTKYLEGFMDDLLGKITDPICVILLLRFAYGYKGEMERRKVFKIDQHLSYLINKITERFHSIILMNLTAIENADPRMFHENSSTSHYANAMTRRFSEFSTSLSQLMNDDIYEMMTPQLHLISAAVIDLLERISKEFKTPELSDIFLINNYYLVFSTLQTVDDCVLLELFQQKLNDCTSHFIDLELKIHFKKLVDTVRQAFTKLESREDPIHIAIGESELKEIAINFKENHVKKMKEISESQITKFDDFQNGQVILQLLSRRLIIYWSKFDQLCHSVVKNGPTPSWFSNLISGQQIVCNIKPLMLFN